MNPRRVKQARFGGLWTTAVLFGWTWFALAHPQPPQPTCLNSECRVLQWPSGSCTISQIRFYPEPPVCDWLWIFAEFESVPSQVTTQLVWSPAGPGCPPIAGTYTSWPLVMGTRWTLEPPVGDIRSGEGQSIRFYPDVGGKWKVTFVANWRHENPCTKQPYGGGTVSKSATFDVIKLEITPAVTNALINRCQDEHRSVKFCLTNSYYPGGVTWSLEPNNVPDGATLSGGGDCAIVKIGNVVTQYMIIARANANTNCAAYAHLRVGRDCDCANHRPSADWKDAPGCTPDSPGCPPDGWFEYGSLATRCGNTLQLSCYGSVHYFVNGMLVGRCPYLPSGWWAYYKTCLCGDVIMAAHFTVVCTDPCSQGPGIGKGKTELWTCTGGFERTCFEPLPGGGVTNRTCIYGVDY